MLAEMEASLQSIQKSGQHEVNLLWRRQVFWDSNGINFNYYLQYEIKTKKLHLTK